jgi:hypothetical protein
MIFSVLHQKTAAAAADFTREYLMPSGVQVAGPSVAVVFTSSTKTPQQQKQQQQPHCQASAVNLYFQPAFCPCLFARSTLCCR